MDKWQSMSEKLASLEQQQLRRSLKEFTSPQSRIVQVEGQKQYLFSSNSYLDMCSEPRVQDYVCAMTRKYGTGSGGSRLTTGTLSLHLHLEELLAQFKRREAALVFNTGYMANVGIISALAGVVDYIYSDELNHASIIDGCRLAKAKLVVYRHNDMADLEARIQEHPHSSGLIVSDGVFSMDGDIVNLPGLVELARKYQLLSMIDEAHATGVLGATGRGTEEYYGMEDSVDVLMGTLSKSVGCEGGFVCGSRLLIEYLLNHARSFIFSTSLAPMSLAAAIKGLEIIMEEPQRIRRLQENIRYFCSRLQENGISVHAETAIIPIIIGDEGLTLQIMQELEQRGYYISGIRYPTVARGRARLRITLMSSHTQEDMDGLVQALVQCREKLQINLG